MTAQPPRPLIPDFDSDPERFAANQAATRTAVDIVAEQFSITEVSRWDTAVVRLPDVAAVRLFLRGRGLSDVATAEEAARRHCPLSVTKRGCLIWAQKTGPQDASPHR